MLKRISEYIKLNESVQLANNSGISDPDLVKNAVDLMKEQENATKDYESKIQSVNARMDQLRLKQKEKDDAKRNPPATNTSESLKKHKKYKSLNLSTKKRKPLKEEVSDVIYLECVLVREGKVLFKIFKSSPRSKWIMKALPGYDTDFMRMFESTLTVQECIESLEQEKLIKSLKTISYSEVESKLNRKSKTEKINEDDEESLEECDSADGGVVDVSHGFGMGNAIPPSLGHTGSGDSWTNGMKQVKKRKKYKR